MAGKLIALYFPLFIVNVRQCRLKVTAFLKFIQNILSQTKLNNYLLLLIVTNTIAVAFVVTCIALVK